MDKKYVLTIDFGGTNSKCCIFDFEGNLISKVTKENKIYKISPEMIEWHGEDIEESLYEIVKTTIENCNVKAEEIMGVCFTVCRCVMVLRDMDGKYIAPIYLVLDTRGGEMLPWMREKLEQAGLAEADLYQRTGLPLGASYPSSKLYWVMKNQPDVYEKTYRIHTLMGLVTKAFGADDYYDDKNDAPWLQLNNDKNEYDSQLCEVFGVDINKLSPLKEAGEIIGYVTESVAQKTGLKVGTPLIMGSGDQQSGGLGAGCIYEEIGYVGLGTGGNVAAKSKNILRDANGKCQVLGAPDGGYVIEGQANVSGSAFKWFMQILCEKESMLASLQEKVVYDLMTKEAEKSAVGSNGCLFLPYLQGANTPIYNGNAKGAFVGLSLYNEKSDFIRAIMEGVVFEIKDMMQALENSGVSSFSKVRVTGGVSNSDFWNQIQADVYDKVVETVTGDEIPSLGAAIIATVGLGYYKSYQEAVNHMVRVRQRFFPKKDNVAIYKTVYKKWKLAYEGLGSTLYCDQ